MTAKTTIKTEDRPRALPWGKWNEELERQIAAHTTPESIEATYQAYLRGETRTGRPLSSRAPMVQEFHTSSRPATTQAARPAAPARDYTPSDAQIRFLDSLLAERVHSYTQAQIAEGKADWRKIRPMLDALKLAAKRPWQAPVEVVEEPAPARTRLNFDEITDGNYAIRVDGVVKFYRVSTSKRGFKNVQVRASDQLFMQFGKAGIAILHRIVEAGLEESRMLFAQELGCCWRCGRTLTDEESRARGMGPDCAQK